MKQMVIESKKIFGVLIVLIMLYIMPVGMASAAQVGDTFSDEGGNITYEVTSVGYTKTCAVTGWKSECVKVIIPEKVVYDKTEYTAESQYNDTYYKCTCPTCGNTVYIPH